MTYVNIVEILALISGIMAIPVFIIMVIFADDIYSKLYLISSIALIMLTFYSAGLISYWIRENNIPGIIFSLIFSEAFLFVTYGCILNNKEE